MKYKIFKKIGILLIMCAIVGIVSVCAVDATWVGHCGKYFQTGDYLCTVEAGVKVNGTPYNYNAFSWTKFRDLGWNINHDDWTTMLRELANQGYCECIYYKNKKEVVYKFNNKSMAPGEYYAKYFEYSLGPDMRYDIRVKISVNNGKTSWW